VKEFRWIYVQRLNFLIQYTRVTDGRTDGIGVAYTRYSIYAVARKKNQTYQRNVNVMTRALHGHVRQTLGLRGSVY